MTHFVGLVIAEDEAALEKLLAPYWEELEVEPAMQLHVPPADHVNPYCLMRTIIAATVLATTGIGLAACSRPADVASYNLSLAADNFDHEYRGENDD